MNDHPEPLPKLKMAPRETLEDLTHREERLQRAEQLQRETLLGQSLAPFRVGSVPYLNAAPLTRGLEDQLIFAPPAQLAEMLRRDELDAALVSIIEVLTTDRYDILDGVGIASLGEVKSVLLAHRAPLVELREIYCDTASLTSVALLKVLLAEKGLHPAFKSLPDYGAIKDLDAFMLIGDTALEFQRSQPTLEVMDLGLAWLELTGLPFVYAVWALRRGMENRALRRELLEAKSFGLDTLDAIISDRTDFDYDFRKDYLTWNVHFHLGADARRGIARFMELLTKHGLGPVFTPHFVA